MKTQDIQTSLTVQLNIFVSIILMHILLPQMHLEEVPLTAERRMSNLSKELSGVILPHDHFGTHLDHKIKLLKKNLNFKILNMQVKF